MGFFQTMIEGYKIWGRQISETWNKHGAQILTGGGTVVMLVSAGLMAKRGASEDVKKAIEEANAAIAEVQAIKVPTVINSNGVEVPDKKEARKKKYRLATMKAKKLYKVGSKFWREGAIAVAGALTVAGGQHMNTVQKTTLATGLAAVSAEFASYRANVVADQGEEKDLEYMTTKQVNGAKKVKTKDGTILEDNSDDGGGVTVKADPNAFKFYFSKETCPSLYEDNLDITILNLEMIEKNLARMLRRSAAVNKNGIGTLYLNDMRREFGGMEPRKMDVPLGGIFGITLNKNDAESCKKYAYRVDLGWSHDQDFMEGRKQGVWIIYPHDDEPIAGKVNQALALTEVER